jgi:hypothetical protein
VIYLSRCNGGESEEDEESKFHSYRDSAYLP